MRGSKRLALYFFLRNFLENFYFAFLEGLGLGFVRCGAVAAVGDNHLVVSMLEPLPNTLPYAEMHVSTSREDDNVLLFALSNYDEKAEVLVSFRATRHPFVVEQQG